jgi:hypothetical protein
MDRLLLLVLLLAGSDGTAQGQTVYACRRDGLTLYQDRPCGADQRILELEVPDAQPPPPGVQAELDYMAARHPGSRGVRRAAVRPIPRERARPAR